MKFCLELCDCLLWQDYSNIDGERCGICMDVVIDRGVLDCCQHWYVRDNTVSSSFKVIVSLSFHLQLVYF